MHLIKGLENYLKRFGMAFSSSNNQYPFLKKIELLYL